MMNILSMNKIIINEIDIKKRDEDKPEEKKGLTLMRKEKVFQVQVGKVARKYKKSKEIRFLVPQEVEGNHNNCQRNFKLMIIYQRRNRLVEEESLVRIMECRIVIVNKKKQNKKRSQIIK